MKRRKFTQNLALLPAALVACTADIPVSDESEVTVDKNTDKLLKPRKLRQGDTVGLIAPASPVSARNIEQAIINMNKLGLNVRFGRHSQKKWGYLAGSDEERVEDLHQMFEDDSVHAIWCIRGGYGITRMLPLLNFDMISQHLKPVIGYSDITALHIALHQKLNWVTFHGPVGSSDMEEYVNTHIKKTLFNPQESFTIHPSKETWNKKGEVFSPYVITPGKAEGALTGGNLTLLSALCGTPWEPIFRDRLVFLEDIDEKPYRIDRMLTQLLQSTDLSNAKGIILGIFKECVPGPGDRSLTLRETLTDRLKPLAIPVSYGHPIGHIDHQSTIPLGIKATFDSEDYTITLLEPPVL